MSKKDDLKARLDELGVEYPSNATNDELEALIAEAEAATDDSEESEEETEESEEDAETEEEESEDDSEEEESEDEEEANEPEFSDASADVTRYGVYRGDNCVAVFTQENHGDDFKEIAEAKAKKLSEGGREHTARPFEDPAKPTPEKNVVVIVNKNGNEVRTFSQRVHGKEYKKLADDFVKKYGEKKGLHIKS